MRMPHLIGIVSAIIACSPRTGSAEPTTAPTGDVQCMLFCDRTTQPERVGVVVCNTGDREVRCVSVYKGLSVRKDLVAPAAPATSRRAEETERPGPPPMRLVGPVGDQVTEFDLYDSPEAVEKIVVVPGHSDGYFALPAGLPSWPEIWRISCALTIEVDGKWRRVQASGVVSTPMARSETVQR